jgi:putative transcriptional regulator
MQIRMKYLFIAFAAALIFSQTLTGIFSPLLSAYGEMVGAVSVHDFGNVMSAVPYSPDASLARGQFLVADRHIRGSLFSQAVILLVSYSPNGAMGLIINHPTNVELSSVLPEIKGVKGRKDRVYVGGPVGMDEMFLLIRTGSKPEASLRVFGNVYMSMSRKTLEGIVAKGPGGGNFHIYAGYAGWAPGQLEREVSRGDWHVLDADAGTIFDREPDEIWPDLISKASVQWVGIWDSPARSL